MELEDLRQKANRVLRRQWLKYTLRNVSNNDNHEGLDRIYLMPDPWNLNSPREHCRFEATNALIRRNFGIVPELLEIGCGEGMQSSFLQEVCHNLHGVEVSPTAVSRARARLPAAHFETGDLLHQDWLRSGRHFDLVVACEVLYYVSDLDATVAEMNRLGDACLVSFFSPEAPKLTAAVEKIPGVQKDWFHFDGVTWLIAWWRNRESARGHTGDTTTPAPANGSPAT